MLTFVLMLQVSCFLTSCLVCFYSFGGFVLVFVEFFALFFLFWVEYLGDGRRHGLWLIVSCGGGGVRGFFISSALCSRIWMSASSKHRSCQVLIIVNEFHLLRRFTFPPADTRQRAGPSGMLTLTWLNGVWDDLQYIEICSKQSVRDQTYLHTAVQNNGNNI